MYNRRGFTLLELALVIIIVAVLVGLFLPTMSVTRRPARQMENSARIRGIHQNLIIYSDGNNGYYPGLSSGGEAVDLTIANRYQILLERDYFYPDYIISPGEQLTAWVPVPRDQGQAVTSANYSYTMLQAQADRPRIQEWRDTSNSLAVVMSDRNVGSDNTAANAKSIWTTSPGDWRGSVGWNDNHVTFETSLLMSETQYGASPKFTDDNIFLDADATASDQSTTVAGDDAYMIHTGE